MSLEGTRQDRVPRCLTFGLGVVAFLLAALANAAVTLHVTTTDAVPGEQVLLDVGMTRDGGEGSVATMQVDLLFDTTQWNLGGECADGQGCTLSEQCGGEEPCRYAPHRCTLDPRLTEHVLEVVPPDFQNVGPNLYRLRFAVVGTRLPIPTISDGPIFRCSFDLRSDAPTGPQRVSAERLQVADDSIPAQPLPAEVVLRLGNIIPGTPGPTWTPTATGTRPTSTPTPTDTPATESPTPETPTETPAPPTETPAPPTETPATPVTPTPGERTPCPSPRPAPLGPAVYVEDLVLNAMGDATITVRLVTGGRTVVATQNDLEFGPGVRVKARGNGRPDCTVESSLGKEGSAFSFLPPGCGEEGCRGMRAVVISFENVDPIPDGSVLYRCAATVTTEESNLAVTNVILSDAQGERIPSAVGREGVVCVEPVRTPSPTAIVTSTPTYTATRPAPSPTPTLTAPPVSPSPTVTGTVATPTPTAFTPTVTRTPVRTPTATATTPPVSDGDGCDCNISGSRRGWSSAWLVLPALLLWWRRSRLSA